LFDVRETTGSAGNLDSRPPLAGDPKKTALRLRRRGALGLAIAALRETSIIFGALIGAVFFGERLGAKRAMAAAAVLAGVVLISLP
jgi:hypothetical protein